MDENQQFFLDDSFEDDNNQLKSDRRQTAKEEYYQAANYAYRHGFQLIQHTDAHYKVKTPDFVLEVYPGNLRIYRHSSDVPFIKLPDNWTLMDVVKSVAEITYVKKPTIMSPQEEFKQASLFASQCGFYLFKRGKIYSVRPTRTFKSDWEIVIDTLNKTITRVNNKGPHPELEENWNLIDVVAAINKRLQLHKSKIKE